MPIVGQSFVEVAFSSKLVTSQSETGIYVLDKLRLTTAA